MLNGHGLNRALDALQAIPPDLPRDEWIKVGMAAHAAGLDFAEFDQWSAPAPSYKPADCREAWKSFKSRPGGVGVGTLYHMAYQYGWRARDASTTPKQNVSPKTTYHNRTSSNGITASVVFSRLSPATSEHSYVVAKHCTDVELSGLRVVPKSDSLHIMGESMVGALAVPCIAPDGEISSIQFITPPITAERLKSTQKPTKLNLPGHSIHGWFTVGKVDPQKPIYVVEGIGQAWSCHKATSCAAVVCFGAGNMVKVASALREQYPLAHLVVVPDVGKEADAQKIAEKVDGLVASMPAGWDANSDVNDLMQKEGLDALRHLLESASEPVTEPHPLAKFVEFNAAPRPPRWVIPGFIGHGVTVISGGHGVGKTTALLPLALTAAGLHGGELMPYEWRRVVYISEDIEQAQRVLAGIVGHSNLGLNKSEVMDRIHLVEAVRLDPQFVVQVGATYRRKFKRDVKGVEVLPLVVLDTKSAVMSFEDENNNSEGSAMMAALKQSFDGLPVWLIGHLAKGNLISSDLTRSDVTMLTTRGASAVEADANQTMFLINVVGKRYLVLGKKRFEPKWPELEIVSYCTQVCEKNEFGIEENFFLRWGIASPAETTRKEALEISREQARNDDAANLRQEVRDAIDVAWRTGYPLNREGVKAKVSRKISSVISAIENLLSERWLYEVPVPAKVRSHSRRTAFLVNLTTQEHEAYVRNGVLPEEKLEIPASWKKPVKPSIPATEDEVSDSEVLE